MKLKYNIIIMPEAKSVKFEVHKKIVEKVEMVITCLTKNILISLKAGTMPEWEDFWGGLLWAAYR